MDPVRFRRLIDLLGGALERPEAEQLAWLAARCGADAELLEEARALLALPSGLPLADVTRHIEAGVGGAAADAAREAAPTPEWIGPYRVLEVLGEGGMGVVYGARQEEPLERDVAVKVIRSGPYASRMVARFEAERRTLASLDHPYIAHIFDAGATGEGLPYFAMEWVRGEPITRYCDVGGLGLEPRLCLFQKVLSAVQHAHQKAVVHRDLKPSNVLVTEVDGGPVPKVIDFGVALAVSDSVEASGGRGAFKARVGTLEYMSPEQALSTGDGVDIRSDVYSLGVLLYELIAGRLPFPPETVEEGMVHARSRDRAAGRATLPGGLPGDLGHVAAMALSSDRTGRYPTVAQFAEDIERYLDGRPVNAHPSTWPYRTRRFLGRHRLRVSAAAAVILLLLGVSGAFTVRLAAERDRAQLEADRAREVAGFLQGIFHAPDPSNPDAPEITARELLDQGAERIGSELAGQPAVQASLLGVVGNTYRGLGHYDEAVRRLGEALDLQRSLHGGRSLDVASSLHDLGNAQLDVGTDLEGARTALEEALALGTELLGAADPATARTMAALALVLREQGDYAEAERLARDAVAVQRRTLGPEHVDLASGLHNLGFVLRSWNRGEEAEAAYREALEIRRGLLDPSHPDLLTTMGNLALMLEERGLHAETEALLREVVERREARQGAEHPLTLNALNSLAFMLWRTGHYGQAEASFRQAVPVGRAVFGEEHRVLAVMLNNLGVALRRSGELEEAEASHREALAMSRRLFPPDHPRIASDMDNLGRVLVARGDAAGAEEFHREALAMRTRLGGEEDPELAVSLLALAEARVAREAHDEAEDLLRRALALRVAQFGEESLRTVEAAFELGALLRGRGGYEEADTLLQGALEVRTALLDSGHPDVAATLRELGALRRDTGRYDEAASLLGDAHARALERLGAEDIDVLRIEAELRRLQAAVRESAAS